MVSFLLAIGLLIMSLIALYYMDNSIKKVPEPYQFFASICFLVTGVYVLYVLVGALILYFS